MRMRSKHSPNYTPAVESKVAQHHRLPMHSSCTTDSQSAAHIVVQPRHSLCESVTPFLWNYEETFEVTVAWSWSPLKAAKWTFTPLVTELFRICGILCLVQGVWESFLQKEFWKSIGKMLAYSSQSRDAQIVQYKMSTAHIEKLQKLVYWRWVPS